MDDVQRGGGRIWERRSTSTTMGVTGKVRYMDGAYAAESLNTFSRLVARNSRILASVRANRKKDVAVRKTWRWRQAKNDLHALATWLAK
jgi:hypothetical protein